MKDRAAITAIGIATPPYKQSQLAASEIVATALNLPPAKKRLLKSVYKATGIQYRHSVLQDFCKQPGEYEFFPNEQGQLFPSTSARMQRYKIHALDLALQAIENCLQPFPQFNPKDITHVITVSCTGMYAPGLDIEIVQQLNLNADVKRTAINFMGCYGAFNAIKTAEAICLAYPTANVLVVCVELCTIHFQNNGSMDNIFSNAIFADGAAAVLIQNQTRGEKKFTLEAFHCDLLPQSEKAMAWHIADYGFDIILSAYVPQAIQSGIAAFTQRLLEKHCFTLQDVDLYAIHPGGYKILKVCEAALMISENANKYAYQVLREYGNMSSATVLFVLKAMWDEISVADAGKKIFSCAFGPGLTLESMLLRVNF